MSLSLNKEYCHAGAYQHPVINVSAKQTRSIDWILAFSRSAKPARGMTTEEATNIVSPEPSRGFPAL